jgi:CRISPR-associated protein Cas1
VIKRTLEISREPAHLSVRDEQLVLKRDGQIVGQVPCEDIGVVLVDHPQTTYTHGALTKLAESDAAVVICGRDHLPAAILLPMVDHSQVVWRLDAQLGVSRPLRKQLWRQLVVAKVEAQARNLSPELPAHRKLLALAREVRSGDPMNVEAQAARIYWNNWLDDEPKGSVPDFSKPKFTGEARGSVPNFSEPKLGTDPGGRELGTDPGTRDSLDFVFRRDPDLPGLNSFLNYGYAVLRAAIARAIVAAGLLPSLGLYHRNRSNAFCLADDLIEPLRPLVDDRVRELHRQGYDELNQPAKAALLEILADRVQFGDEVGPLMVTLHRYVASLVRCFTGDERELQIPLPWEGDAPAEPLPNAPGAASMIVPCPLHPAP